MRRLAGASLVALATLVTACGSDPSDARESPDDTATTVPTSGVPAAPTTVPVTVRPGDSGALPVIEVGDQPAAPPAAAPMADQAESKMMAAIEFVYAGEPADLTSPATAWFFAPGATPAAEELTKIAAQFGVTGDVRELSKDFGGGLVIGPADGSAPSVSVGTDAMLSWWYSAGDASMNVPVCDMPESLPNDTSIDPSTDAAVPECPQMDPPENVPSAEEAEELATALLEQLGIDPGSYELETFADEWSAGVSAFLVLDGVRSSAQMFFSFGEDGAVTWAGGFLAEPQRGAEYPRIGIDAAIARLNEPLMSMTLGENARGYEPAAGETADATSAAEVSTLPADVGDSVLTDPAIDCDDPATSCLPTGFEPETITLTGVEPSLEQLWAQDGTVWLLPGYAFSAEEGGPFTVIAVEEQYLSGPDGDTPVASDDPVTSAVAEPGVEPAPSTIATDFGELVSVPVDEAAEMAELMGFEMRVVREDGVDLAVTDDYRTDRVNVAVEDGVVVETIGVG